MIWRPVVTQRHHRSAVARERSGRDRDAVSELRDESAAAREQTAADRDRAAERRDRGAKGRDRRLTGGWTRTFGLEEVWRELERAHRTGATLVLGAREDQPRLLPGSFGAAPRRVRNGP